MTILWSDIQLNYSGVTVFYKIDQMTGQFAANF